MQGDAGGLEAVQGGGGGLGADAGGEVEPDVVANPSRAASSAVATTQ